jgi:hypothetical protein
MEHAEVEVLLGCHMRHTGEEHLPERPVIGPCGKGSIDIRIVQSWFAVGVFWNGQALPLHPGVG